MKIKRDEAWQKLVGKRLRIGLQVAGRRQAEVAKALDISPQRLGNYITGTRPLDIETATEICDQFGLTLDFLYRGTMHTLPKEIYDGVYRFMGAPGATKH
jgi:transcriptional regulator with XRE-family HTH domain